MMTTNIQPNLINAQVTSILAKNLLPKTLIRLMTTKKIEIQAAIGTLSVQKLRTVLIAVNSLAMVSTYMNQ